jgi:hypothetical protein
MALRRVSSVRTNRRTASVVCCFDQPQDPPPVEGGRAAATVRQACSPRRCSPRARSIHGSATVGSLRCFPGRRAIGSPIHRPRERSSEAAEAPPSQTHRSYSSHTRSLFVVISWAHSGLFRVAYRQSIAWSLKGLLISLARAIERPTVGPLGGDSRSRGSSACAARITARPARARPKTVDDHAVLAFGARWVCQGRRTDRNASRLSVAPWTLVVSVCVACGLARTPVSPRNGSRTHYYPAVVAKEAKRRPHRSRCGTQFGPGLVAAPPCAPTRPRQRPAEPRRSPASPRSTPSDRE